MIDINRLSVGDKVVFVKPLQDYEKWYTLGKEYTVEEVNTIRNYFTIRNNLSYPDYIKEGSSISGKNEVKWFNHVDPEPMYNNYTE